jgi:hypothetical protein
MFHSYGELYPPRWIEHINMLNRAHLHINTMNRVHLLCAEHIYCALCIVVEPSTIQHLIRLRLSGSSVHLNHMRCYSYNPKRIV